MSNDSSTPYGWRYGRINEFFELQRGFDLTESESLPGNVPVVSSSGISYYHNVAQVQPPGVVTGRKGRLGLVFYLDIPFWPHDTTLWVRDFKGNEPQFVRVFLEYLELEQFDAATSVPTLNRNNVHSLLVNFPPLVEQRKIAAILSTWDEAITLTRQLIDALKQRKQALMQLLLTGQVRFPKFVRSAERQHIDFGTLPKDWRYVHIGEVAKSVSERNENGEALPVLSCTKYDGLVDSLAYFGRQVFSDDLATYKVVRRGQFAYATNHIEEGSIGYQDLYDEALISPMYTVFETIEGIQDDFLYNVLKTELYRHIFEINTSASVDRRGSLRWSQFSRIHIPLPEISEQKVISEVLKTASEVISTYMELLDRLQTQKRGLMQQLLTGAIRVQGDA